MMLGVTILTKDRATISSSGLQVGLIDEEQAELEQTGSVRRQYGNTVLSARKSGCFIVLMLWEQRRHPPRTTNQQHDWHQTPSTASGSCNRDWLMGVSGLLD